MSENKKDRYYMITIVIISCIIMAIVETIIEPAYIVKSATKVIVFFLLPLICMKLLNIKLNFDSFVLKKKDILKLLLLGSLIYFVVIEAYILTRDIFDYPSLVESLSVDQKVDSKNFIWIALYISFGNSFLEEFLFRFISFIKLSEYMPKRITYAFSSILFAIYHIGMIGTSFPLPLLIVALIGLSIGGWIFDYVDEKSKNIYNSWIIHMFADFAIMTIWFIHI